MTASVVDSLGHRSHSQRVDWTPSSLDKSSVAHQMHYRKTAQKNVGQKIILIGTVADYILPGVHFKNLFYWCYQRLPVMRACTDCC